MEQLTSHTESFWNDFKVLIYGVFIYLKIETEPVTVLSILMCIDTVLGAIKILRINSNDFSLKLLILGFFSKLAFLLLPVTIALIGKNINYDFKIFVELSLKILSVSEGISIISNLIAIKTKEKIENYDVITKFLKYIRGIFINIAVGYLNKKK